jgi:hypothetical protein
MTDGMISFGFSRRRKMNQPIRTIVTIAGMATLGVSLGAAETPSHFESVNQRGDQAMGFDHSKSTHHFRLTPHGGSIGVDANDPKDKTSLKQIREHLTHIKTEFAKGNFAMPMFIHDRIPPGVETMTRLKDTIHYDIQTTKNGAKVRMTTKDPAALKAIHDFLTFQIEDHQTGDPVSIQSE